MWPHWEHRGGVGAAGQDDDVPLVDQVQLLGLPVERAGGDRAGLAHLQLVQSYHASKGEQAVQRRQRVTRRVSSRAAGGSRGAGYFDGPVLHTVLMASVMFWPAWV